MTNNFEKEFERLNHFEDGVDDSVWLGVSSKLEAIEKKKKKRTALFFFISIPMITLFVTHFFIPFKKPLTNIETNKTIDNKTQSIHQNQPKVDKEKQIFSMNNSERINQINLNQPLILNANENIVFPNENTVVEDLNNAELTSSFIVKLKPMPINQSQLSSIEFIELKKPLKKSNTLNKINVNIDLFQTKSIYNQIGSGQAYGFQFGKKFGRNKIISIGATVQKQQFKAYHHEDTPFGYAYDSILAINDKREVFYFKKYDTLILTNSNLFKTNIMHVAIPVGVRHSLVNYKKLSIDLSLETVFLYQLSENKKWNTTRGTKLLKANYDEVYQYKHKFNMMSTIGLRMNYQVYKQHQLFVSPRFGFGFTSLQNTLTQKNTHLKPIDLQFGYSFNF